METRQRPRGPSSAPQRNSKVNSTGKVSFTGFAFDEYLSPLVHCIDFAAATPWHEKRNLCRAALFSHDADKSFDPRSFLTALAKCEHRLISREPFWVRTSVSDSRTAEASAWIIPTRKLSPASDMAAA